MADFYAAGKNNSGAFSSPRKDETDRTEKIITLEQVPPGRTGRILELRTEKCIWCRLLALGLLPGTEVKVSGNLSGAVVLGLPGGGRLTLDVDLARQVVVELKEEPTEHA